jgi:uncharacterized membrane protein YgdD (TMEM256/DUF423 family)
VSASTPRPPRRGSPWIALAAVLGASGVGLAAFGTHALRGRLAAPVFATWDIAVDYQLLHAAVLLALGLYESASGRSVRLPASLLALGLALFSGSLYLLVATGWSTAGVLAPLGGVTLLAGWLSLVTLTRGASLRA